MDNGRALISRWYEQFAPGLAPPPIPDEAVIEGVHEPFTPHGVQYCVRMPNGERYPFHQSGPSAVLAITDGVAVALREDLREESGKTNYRCCEGYAGTHTEVAKEIVSVFNQLKTLSWVSIHEGEYQSLRPYLAAMLAESYPGFALNGHTITFLDRPIGNPNIHFCSILGRIKLSPAEFERHAWPRVLERTDVVWRCVRRSFDSDFTDRLIRRLFISDFRP